MDDPYTARLREMGNAAAKLDKSLLDRIAELEAHIEKWVFVTALDTFEDRERFRTESEKLLYSQSDAAAEQGN